jgi:hypothetical protein
MDNVPKFRSLAAWRSGHRIRLRNRRPGFESRQGLRFLGSLSSAVVYNRLNLCACVLKKTTKGIGQKQFLNVPKFQCFPPTKSPKFKIGMH